MIKSLYYPAAFLQLLAQISRILFYYNAYAAKFPLFCKFIFFVNLFQQTQLKKSSLCRQQNINKAALPKRENGFARQFFTAAQRTSPFVCIC